MEALDISEAAGIEPDEMTSVMVGKRTKQQAMLLYALAWVIARRAEPDLTFAEVLTYHLTVVGSAPSAAQIASEQRRAMTIVSVAKLAGVTPDEAGQMSVAQVSAVTSLTKARRGRRR